MAFMKTYTYRLQFLWLSSQPAFARSFCQSFPNVTREEFRGGILAAKHWQFIQVGIIYGLENFFKSVVCGAYIDNHIVLIKFLRHKASIHYECRAVQSLGMFLSPLVGASLIEARPRAKRLALAFGVGTRLQILLLALLALFAPEGVARWGVWIAIGCWGLFNGLQGVTFNELIANTVPLQRRAGSR